MLARYEPTLRERGPHAYRELFWETGLIGQALYLGRYMKADEAPKS